MTILCEFNIFRVITLKFAKIIGTGSYSPDKVLTNFDFEKIVDTSDEWIRTRTGIVERHIAEPEIASSDMAYEASLQALDYSGIHPNEIDAIIVGTVTPDYLFPSTACILQSKLKAKRAHAFDILAGCSGFLYSLHIANGLIKSGSAKTILAIGSETLSRIVDYEDRSTCILFGDGAGAAVVQSSSEPGILSSLLGSDGNQWELLYLPAGGSKKPATIESVKNKEHFVRMKGNDVFKVAVKSLESASIEAIEKAGLTPEDIDLFIPHQANYRIIEAVRKRLNMPEEKVYINVDRYGNTSSASVPIALDEALRKKLIHPGDTVLFSVFGAGFTWGATVTRF